MNVDVISFCLIVIFGSTFIARVVQMSSKHISARRVTCKPVKWRMAFLLTILRNNKVGERKKTDKYFGRRNGRDFCFFYQYNLCYLELRSGIGIVARSDSINHALSSCSLSLWLLELPRRTSFDAVLPFFFYFYFLLSSFNLILKKIAPFTRYPVKASGNTKGILRC